MDINTGNENPVMSADEQLAAMETAGLECVNNAWIASRFPPSDTIGLHPAGYYEVCSNGDLFNQLREQLGEPLSPKQDFGQAAEPSPTITPSLDPKFLS